MTFKKLRRGQPAVPFPLACAVCSLLDGVLVPCSLLCPGIPFLCSIFGSVAPVLVLERRLTLSRRGAASCMSACRSSIPLAHPTDEPPMPLHQRNRPAMPPSPQPHTHTQPHPQPQPQPQEEVQLQQQHPQQQEEPLPPSLAWPLRHPASGSFSFAENTSPFQRRPLPPSTEDPPPSILPPPSSF